MKDTTKMVIEVLDKRRRILFEALYESKSYADQDTKAFWEGKKCAYREAIDLLKSSEESIGVEL